MKKQSSILRKAAWLVALLMLFASLTTLAARTPTIRISDAVTSAGNRVTVDMFIEYNPGIAGIVGTVVYDTTNFTLTDIQKGPYVDGMFFADPTESNGFSFVRIEDTTEDGLFASFVFEVSPYADDGTYSVDFVYSDGNISNSKEESVYFSVESGSITIGCVHSYSPWESLSEKEHRRTCKLCNSFETLPHRFDEGVVTTAPTEKAEGKKKFTCLDCNAVKIESIPALTHTHAFGTTWEKNSDGHYHACACGEKQEVFPHEWDAGVITHVPTSSVAGAMTYTCTVCGFTRNEPIVTPPPADTTAETTAPVETTVPAETTAETTVPVETTVPAETTAGTESSAESTAESTSPFIIETDPPSAKPNNGGSLGLLLVMIVSTVAVAAIAIVAILRRREY